MSAVKGGLMAGMRKMGLAFAAVSLAGGCVSFGKDPPDQLISLTPALTAPAGAIASGDVSTAIVLLNPEVDQRLDVNRVPVQVDASTVAYLKDAFWVERPARQFRNLVAETIRAGGKRLVLHGEGLESGARTVLSGRLLDMGYDARRQSVVVRYDALLENSDGTIRSHRFESIVPGVSPTAAAVVPALNQAANAVAKQIADWVG